MIGVGGVQAEVIEEGAHLSMILREGGGHQADSQREDGNQCDLSHHLSPKVDFRTHAQSALLQSHNSSHRGQLVG